jgi:preprotein translocase subunit SecG
MKSIKIEAKVLAYIFLMLCLFFGYLTEKKTDVEAGLEQAIEFEIE